MPMRLATCAFCLVVWSVGFGGMEGTGRFEQIRSEGATVAANKDRWRQEAVLQSGTLHDAAKITGVFLQAIPAPGQPGPESLTQLSRLSELVVRGVTTRVDGMELSGDGRSISTVFRFRVTETFKGNVAPEIRVRLPGGQVKYSDGSRAVQRVAEFNRLRLEAEYVLYLRSDGTGAYASTSGPLGVYCLTLVNVRYVNTAGLISSSPLGLDISRKRLTPPQFVSLVRQTESAMKKPRGLSAE